MGIFGALNTAVAGMRAQAYALENISGNIANSQTTAFKRIDTAFEDLIPDQPPKQQLSGSVSAYSNATNTVQGDIQNASVSTYMAINGAGFFVIAQPSSVSDGRPIFDGTDLYTRRGDFQLDQNGYLVNGAGNYLMGIPIDATTGNLAGSVPEILQFQSGFLPALATTEIDYQANLASYPLTADHNTAVPGSELLNPSNFQSDPTSGTLTAAKILGSGGALSNDALAVRTGTADLSALSSGGGTLVINSHPITVTAGDDLTDLLADINGATGTTGVTATLVANKLVLTGADADTDVTIGGASTLTVLTELGLTVGTTQATNILNQGGAQSGDQITIQVGSNAPLTITFGTGGSQVSTMGDLSTALAQLNTLGLGGTATVDPTTGNITVTAGNTTDQISISGSATMENFGIHTLTGLPSNGTVIANDLSTFLNESISGGAVTAYDVSGSPVNVQLRWAKTDTATLGSGHTDTWNLFYQVDSNATGVDPAWKNAGTNYTFAANGQMSPAVNTITLNNLVVNGVALGNVQLVHNAGGITQFSDSNGNVQVNLLQQNGFPAGQLQSVAVSDKGRIVGTYSNGRTIDLASITLANFSGANLLKSLDGGAFAETAESGPPTYNASGKVVGSSLEGSNTDIADEFSKLIVTQQAYSANTRVITTSNQMVQDLLNMLR